MALIETSLIWVAYAVAVGILLAISSIFVYIYQKPSERAISVTTVCIFTVSCLLATALLLPVDVALVSSPVRSKEGRRKDWADQDTVDNIQYQLKVVYYSLYSLDAVLCLLVLPFTYFFYEEYDERETEEGTQTLGSRIMGAMKFTIAFVLLCIILFLVGFFIPQPTREQSKHRDLDFFKHLFTENRPERALTFALGLLITIGTLIYLLYTAAGLALLPITFIRSAPSISVPSLAANTDAELQENRERQHQLESRNEGAEGGLNDRDRRELDRLLQDERTLVRRQRLAADYSGENKNWLIRAWHKTEAVFRPLKLIGGFLLMIIAIVIFVSMLITGVDKAKNSICKRHCGYLLAKINIAQPMNAIFVASSKVFPIDYIIFLLLILLLFSSSVVGIAIIGIRFLWVVIFRIRKGHTSPQAMLVGTMLLALIVLAINFSTTTMIAPQYATYGPQTFCDLVPKHPGEQPDCTKHHNLIRACSERTDNPAAKDVCTPSVVSTFINRITLNFPFFGVIDFWAQFVFLGVFLITMITAFIRTPHLNDEDLDEDLEEAEEEGLLASTGRRLNASWQDITGRARQNNPGGYGTTS